MHSLLRGILDSLQFLLIFFVWVPAPLTLSLNILPECLSAVLVVHLLLKFRLLGKGPSLDLAHAFIGDRLHVGLAHLSLLQILPCLHSVCGYSCIHLREEEAKDSLSVFPLQVVQIDLVRERLLASLC